jgi:CDP-diacylglycerol--glycerol-3-phosphate 3-phosphatidyltransferase
MIGRAIGNGFVWVRDNLARGLIAKGIRPNQITAAGTGLTVLAGILYALSAEHFGLSLRPSAPGNLYLLLAGGVLILSAACDMLDGAVARIADVRTPFGGFLDSTLDRVSDFAVFAGITIHYARAGNMTFALLAMLAFFGGFMISYTRARAENLIPECKVGYWQRGERFTAVLIGTLAYNLPAMVLQQAMLPMLTALRRVLYVRAVVDGRMPAADVRAQGWRYRIRLWRWPRMSWPYDLVTAVNIAWLIFVRFPPVNVLGWL